MGKWAQSQNKTRTTLVASVKGLYDRPVTGVRNVIFQNDDVVWISCNYSEDDITAGKNVNVLVAAYITTKRGNKLYKYMSELSSTTTQTLLPSFRM